MQQRLLRQARRRQALWPHLLAAGPSAGPRCQQSPTHPNPDWPAPRARARAPPPRCASTAPCSARTPAQGCRLQAGQKAAWFPAPLWNDWRRRYWCRAPGRQVAGGQGGAHALAPRPPLGPAVRPCSLPPSPNGNLPSKLAARAMAAGLPDRRQPRQVRRAGGRGAQGVPSSALLRPRPSTANLLSSRGLDGVGGAHGGKLMTGW